MMKHEFEVPVGADSEKLQTDVGFTLDMLNWPFWKMKERAFKKSALCYNRAIGRIGIADITLEMER